MCVLAHERFQWDLSFALIRVFSRANTCVHLCSSRLTASDLKHKSLTTQKLTRVPLEQPTHCCNKGAYIVGPGRNKKKGVNHDQRHLREAQS